MEVDHTTFFCRSEEVAIGDEVDGFLVMPVGAIVYDGESRWRVTGHELWLSPKHPRRLQIFVELEV